MVGPGPHPLATVYGQRLSLGRARRGNGSWNRGCLFTVTIFAYVEAENYEFEVKCHSDSDIASWQVNWLVDEVKYRLANKEIRECFTTRLDI